MSQAYTTIDEWQEFSCAFEQCTEVVTHLRSPQSQQLDYGQVEQCLETEGRKLLRRLLQGHLDHCAAHETNWESLEGSDSIIRNHHRQGCEIGLDHGVGHPMCLPVRGQSTDTHEHRGVRGLRQHAECPHVADAVIAALIRHCKPCRTGLDSGRA